MQVKDCSLSGTVWAEPSWLLQVPGLCQHHHSPDQAVEQHHGRARLPPRPPLAFTPAPGHTEPRLRPGLQRASAAPGLDVCVFAPLPFDCLAVCVAVF